MDNIEKIENTLNDIEERLETEKNHTTLKELQTKLQKLENQAIEIKHYFKKQENFDTTEIQKCIKKAKKLQKIILKKINEQLEDKKEKSKISPKINKPQSPEILRLSTILNSNFTKKEKIKKLEETIYTARQIIECLKVETEDLHQSALENYAKFTTKNAPKVSKKERIAKKFSNKKKNIQEKRAKRNEQPTNKYYKLFRETQMQIKENKRLINEQLYIIERYKTIIIQLEDKNARKIDNVNKDNKNETNRQKEKNYYYRFIEDLLNDDKNYLFLKQIISENSHFQNARLNNKHIIFKVLDKFIMNKKLELVNQKLVHQNPNYYYSLLKIMINKKLDLTVEETIEFTKIIMRFLGYLDQKNYVEKEKIKQEIMNLWPVQMPKPEYDLSYRILYANMSDALKSKNRVDLTQDYLRTVPYKINLFEEMYFNKFGTIPTQEIIEKELQIKEYDIKNSMFIGNTITFEDGKYAYSLNYDKESNAYFRIHLLDTSFIEEDSSWYKELETNKDSQSNTIKKALKFIENSTYPTMTYQLKIALNGCVSSLKIFESKIHIDRKIKNTTLLDYRSDEELKQFVGYIKCLSKDYNFDLFTIESQKIEQLIDFVLNCELKKYFENNHLPTLNFVEFNMTDEEKMKVHNIICEYLGKMKKKEAYQILKNLKNNLTSRFYTDMILEESQMELDTKTYIGYLHNEVIKNHLYNHDTEITHYQNSFQTCANQIQNETVFQDCFTKRELTRKKKVQEIQEKKQANNE